MPLELPPAVIFDCDGTIADTESLADRAWSAILATVGYTPSEQDFAAVVGRPYHQNWDYFSARVDLGDPDQFRARLRATYARLLDTELVIHDDAVATMRAVAAAGVPLAVASSSTRAHVRRIMEQAGVADLVAVVVGADDVERHKPDPLPYLTAAHHLGVAPRDCVAVEDTGVGVAAAVDAGMFTVAVLRGHQTRADLARAHRIVERLDLSVLSIGSSPNRPVGQ